MRRSLAPHAAKRMHIAEHGDRDAQVMRAILMGSHFGSPEVVQPDQTALLQRAARAERQARTWYRLAIALAVGCAVLVLIR